METFYIVLVTGLWRGGGSACVGPHFYSVTHIYFWYGISPWPGTQQLGKAGWLLRSKKLCLPLPPHWWNYKHKSPCPDFFYMGSENWTWMCERCPVLLNFKWLETLEKGVLIRGLPWSDQPVGMCVNIIWVANCFTRAQLTVDCTIPWEDGPRLHRNGS